MSSRFPARVILLLLGALWWGPFAGDAWGQVQFVQLTDPHLFDAGDDLNNARELKACLAEINTRSVAGTNYRFAALTGDLGIEKLTLGDPGQIPIRLEAGARQLGQILSTSRIKTWLVIPGNNDLIDERPDTLGHYRRFLGLLRRVPEVAQAGLQIIDLTPYADQPDSGIYRVESCAFLGFNNASFKSNNLAKNKLDWEISDHHRELVEVERRLDRVTQPHVELDQTQCPVEHVYLFLHIPEIDDPYYLGLTRQDPQSKVVADWFQKKGVASTDAARFSTWTVTDQIRRDWDHIVEQPVVKGLFAGHLHDQRRETYLHLDWIKFQGYSAVRLKKLWLCPPIAAKRQTQQGIPQARGYRTVQIHDDGSVSSDIVWVN